MLWFIFKRFFSLLSQFCNLSKYLIGFLQSIFLLLLWHGSQTLSHPVSETISVSKVTIIFLTSNYFLHFFCKKPLSNTMYHRKVAISLCGFPKTNQSYFTFSQKNVYIYIAFSRYYWQASHRGSSVFNQNNPAICSFHSPFSKIDPPSIVQGTFGVPPI